jgi:hypothetical protein
MFATHSSNSNDSDNNDRSTSPLFPCASLEELIDLDTIDDDFNEEDLNFPIDYDGSTYMYKEESLDQLLNEGLQRDAMKSLQESEMIPLEESLQAYRFGSGGTSSERSNSNTGVLWQQQPPSLFETPSAYEWMKQSYSVDQEPQITTAPIDHNTIQYPQQPAILLATQSRRNSTTILDDTGELHQQDYFDPYQFKTIPSDASLISIRRNSCPSYHTTSGFTPEPPTSNSHTQYTFVPHPSVNLKPESKITKNRKSQRRHSISYIPLDKYTKRKKEDVDDGTVRFETNEYNEFKGGTHETQRPHVKKDEKSFKFTVIEFE